MPLTLLERMKRMDATVVVRMPADAKTRLVEAANGVGGVSAWVREACDRGLATRRVDTTRDPRMQPADADNEEATPTADRILSELQDLKDFSSKT